MTRLQSDENGTISYEIAGYEAFRVRARSEALTCNQRAGFPDKYRAGRSESILQDISGKLPALRTPGTQLLDIGCGCGELAHSLIAATSKHGQSLTLIDSDEMLLQLPEATHVRKITGPFPACLQCSGGVIGPFDAVLVYSVVQYVFAEASLFRFVDAAIELLNDTGSLLLGDLPNTSMRNRFLASRSGRTYHDANFPERPYPVVNFNRPHPGQLDDAVVLALLTRSRAAGLQAFVLPQSPELPMANRREDVLIRRA